MIVFIALGTVLEMIQRESCPFSLRESSPFFLKKSVQCGDSSPGIFCYAMDDMAYLAWIPSFFLVTPSFLSFPLFFFFFGG